MARNGSGVYTPPAASYPAVAGTLIEAAKYNAVIDDMSTAMTESVAINGQTTMTGDLPMGANKVTGMANGVAATDACAYGQAGQAAIAGTVAATDKPTPVDADLFPISDSAAAGVLKKFTWANLKATLAAACSAGWNAATATLATTATTATTATNIAGGAGGSIPYQSAADTTALLANGTVGQVLTSAGTTVPPTWETPTGTLTAGSAATKSPYTVGTVTAAAHGITGVPDFVRTYIECLSADMGYSAGDRVPFEMGSNDSGGNVGWFVVLDATNITIIIHTNANFQIANKGTAAAGLIDKTKWKVVAVPYKLN